MKKKKTVKTRMLSLFLVLLLLAGSVSSVRAEEAAGTEAAGSETTKEQIVESEESVGSGEQGSVPENAELTEGVQNSADAKKEEEDSSDRNVSASSAVKKEEKAKAASDEDKTEEAGVGEGEENQSKTGVGLTATLRVDGYGKSVLYPTSVTLPDTYQTLESYGLGEVKDPGYYTPLHMLAEYCKQHGMDPAQQIDATSEGNVNNFLGATSEGAFMMFSVNNGCPIDPSTGWGYLQGTYPLQSGDQVVLYSWHHYNSVYAYFTEENLNTSTGQTFIVTLKSNDGMGSGETFCEGADILVQDINGNTLESGDYEVKSKTDSKGQVAVTINKAGTYLLTAEKKTDGTQHDLNRPYAKVIVSEVQALTDEEAVQSDKDELIIVGADSVKENLVLPTEGKSGTSITWESSDENCVKKDGTVKRPVGADKKVTLIATINRGKVSDTKEFSITVVGKALFKELKVDHGTLVYDKSIDSYTIYVKEEVDKLTISGIAGEEESDVAFLNVIRREKSGKEGNKFVFPPNDGSFSVETWLKSESGEELTPQNVTLNTMGNVQGTVTLHVKRGTAGTPLPDLPDITWGQHLGDKNNNAVVNSKAPINKAELLWESFSNAPDSWGSVYAGTPILVNNHIYAVRNHKIEMLDAKTGKVKASTKLHSQVGYYSNIIYGGGMIFVPLGNGDVQCFNATTLKSMYLIENPASLGSYWGVYGAMHYDNGKLYIGYSNQGDYGGYAVYDTLDPNIDDEYEVVKPLWMTGEKDQSYYGSGAVTIKDMVVIGGDGGIVSVRNAKTGEELSKCQLSGKIRCSLVYADGYIWTTTQNKKIYKLLLSESGKITVAEEADLPNSSNASPVVTGGKVYITGGVWGAGFLAVYDMNLTLLAQEKGENPFNTPTVSTAYDNVCVYFTENGPEGNLYMAKVTANNKITLKKIYTPKHIQYSMSKVIISSDGTIYYTNDAGYLFAIRTKTSQEPIAPNDNTAGTPPSLKPDKKPTTTVSAQSFAPRKRTVKVNAATKNNVSSESNIVNAIQQSYDKKENSLTIKNPPEVVGAEVFKQLVRYPEFRLVFDCGAYTLSMKGSDVTNVNATLSMKLLEMENTLSEEDAARYGNYQRLMFAQEGPLPGKITVVYKLGEQFEQSEALYLYDLLGNTEAQEVILQKPYGMFVLENGGEFIMSDQKVEEAQEAEAVEISEEIKPVNEKTTGIPVWIYLFIGLGAGALISGLITVKVMNARKRKDTWEK